MAVIFSLVISLFILAVFIKMLFTYIEIILHPNSYDTKFQG